ncbi:MAG: hypothetical protein LC804_20175 [Acidobacteria bacterium]|nr:hypothetical protein [Acidobacteriota bacterium]
MTAAQDFSEYCREIEAYLCRKNAGHLIRVVGPAFELVRGWAFQGVPLKIAFRGIDRYCERYHAKGPKRRPARIEFCDADVLDAFDDWRRAVGVSVVPTGDAAGERAPRKPGLAAHIERVVSRLAGTRPSAIHVPEFDAQIDATLARLDTLHAEAKRARGETRARVIAQLAELDRQLLGTVTHGLAAETKAALEQEAAEELAPFGDRIAPDARARAGTAAFHRLVREFHGLPVIKYE